MLSESRQKEKDPVARDTSLRGEPALFGAYADPHDFARIFAMRRDLIACVRQGDVPALRELLERPDYVPRCQAMFRTLDQAKVMVTFFQAICLYEATGQGVLLEEACAFTLDSQEDLARAETFAAVIDWSARQMLAFAEMVCRIQGNRTQDGRVRKCEEYINEHIYDPISLAALAEVSGLSPVHLERLFRREKGCTLSQWVRQEKIRRAKFLLEHTDLACGEIGQRLSFCSQSYFAQQFRRETEMSPSQWRRAHQLPTLSEV